MTKENIEKAKRRAWIKKNFHKKGLSDEEVMSFKPLYSANFSEGFEAGMDFALSHQWVSVEDRLPEPGQEVLLYNKHSVRRYEIGWLRKKKGDDKSRWALLNGFVEDDDITHWCAIKKNETMGNTANTELIFKEKDIVLCVDYSDKIHVGTIKKVLSDGTYDIIDYEKSVAFNVPRENIIHHYIPPLPREGLVNALHLTNATQIMSGLLASGKEKHPVKRAVQLTDALMEELSK